MIRSIRQFLIISLLISMTIASSITAIGNFLVDKKVIQPYLDEQLIKFYTLIELLTHTTTNDYKTQKQVDLYFNETHSAGTKHLFFQAFSPNKQKILSSKNAPASLSSIPLGFTDLRIHGKDWRVYTQKDSVSHLTISVGELYEIRNDLGDDITRNNGYILLFTYPIFGMLIWIIVGLALRSITRVTNEISNRASTYLEPVKIKNIPIEIQPLVAELNQLFIRLKLAFDRNKRFAADAAHELRTPLAALKTHAQVALKADNAQDQLQALQKVVQSVDRSSHVVAQLLILSRLNQEETLNDLKEIDLHKLAAEIIADLVPIALEKNIEIELASAAYDNIIIGNDIAIGILIRNIVDNAIRYTPPKGEVKIQIIDEEETIIFRVIDSGPGIPIELRERVFERFYRILGTSAQGSGLGLAIVSQIAELHQAQLKLSTPKSGSGLQFDVEFHRLK